MGARPRSHRAVVLSGRPVEFDQPTEPVDNPRWRGSHCPVDADLRGRVVLITGASGGIGSAVARRFADEGALVALHARAGAARARALAAELPKDASFVVTGNLAREADVHRVFERTLKRFGRIDTLVANAGSWEARDVPLADMSLRQWRITQDAVLTSAFLCLREFLRHVRQRRCGNAVIIGSTAGVFGEAGHADYAAAKAAMAYGLTRTLKNEIARLAPHTAVYCGGRVNCVCPGWTVVPRNAAKLGDAGVVRRVTATMALPQIARPDDIAHAVVFLSSDRLARHLTGQIVVVAGGMEGRLLWGPDEIDPALA
jgi:3-oxoacyl-[acyl-carrier protein] reductase